MRVHDFIYFILKSSDREWSMFYFGECDSGSGGLTAAFLSVARLAGLFTLQPADRQ